MNRQKYIVGILASFSFFLLVVSCNQREADKSVAETVPQIPNDSLGYHNKRVLDSLIGLKNIESVGGREYRISFGLNEPMIGYIIVVKEEGNNWKGELHRYLITKVDQASGVISSVKIRPVLSTSPKSGNTSFKSKFEEYKIDSFRNSQDIPGFDECMGINAINIEMSVVGSHRKIYYACPLENESKAPELKSLRALITYIQDEFGFNLWGGDPFELSVSNVDSITREFSK